jgi:uncharacterized protein YjiS (DUF1127 family)
MTTASCCAPASVVAAGPAARASRIALHRSEAQRLLATVVETYEAGQRVFVAWRAEHRQRATERALAQLDRRLLKDLGLADDARPHAEAWRELDRMPW